MKNHNKIFFLIIIMIAFNYPTKSFSQTLPWPYVTGDSRDILEQLQNQSGFDFLKVDNTAYFKLCEIRRMFCGVAKVGIISIAVFILGFLLVIGKLKWITLITVTSGLVLFTAAETVAVALVSLPPNLGVVYSCYCIENILSVLGVEQDNWYSNQNWLQF